MSNETYRFFHLTSVVDLAFRPEESDTATTCDRALRRSDRSRSSSGLRIRREREARTEDERPDTQVPPDKIRPNS